MVYFSSSTESFFFQTEYFLRESLKLVYKKLIFLVLFLSQSVAVLEYLCIILCFWELN